VIAWDVQRIVPPFVTAVAIVMTSLACKEAPSQAVDAVVLDWVSPHLSDADAQQPESHTEDIVVGTDESSPVRLDWTTALDSEGCRRVQRVKATRTGGASDFEIYESRAKDQSECFVDDFAAPGTIAVYDRVVLSFCYRWKGASNDDRCAYEEAMMIRGDAVGLEWRGNRSARGK
jgi:hypothetical protein